MRKTCGTNLLTVLHESSSEGWENVSKKMRHIQKHMATIKRGVRGVQKEQMHADAQGYACKLR